MAHSGSKPTAMIGNSTPLVAPKGAANNPTHTHTHTTLVFL